DPFAHRQGGERIDDHRHHQTGKSYERKLHVIPSVCEYQQHPAIRSLEPDLVDASNTRKRRLTTAGPQNLLRWGYFLSASCASSAPRRAAASTALRMSSGIPPAAISTSSAAAVVPPGEVTCLRSSDAGSANSPSNA